MDKAKVEKIIGDITDLCSDGDYIFRGTPEIYDNRNASNKEVISSTLYREYIKLKGLVNKGLSPINLEEDIVKRAKADLTDYSKYTNIEILTNLRHYGCDLLLIDFSLDIHVALFFACNRKPKKNGELIMLEESMFEPIDHDISYKEPTSGIVYPIPNEVSKNRVLNQKSVFIYKPEGYINKNSHDSHPIEWEDKKDILDYLQKYHNITSNTIYNDFVGFIANEKNHNLSRIKLHSGNLG